MLIGDKHKLISINRKIANLQIRLEQAKRKIDDPALSEEEELQANKKCGILNRELRSLKNRRRKRFGGKKNG